MTIIFEKTKISGFKSIKFEKDVYDRWYIVCIDKDDSTWKFTPDEVKDIVPD
jgi:hypothetical protein